MAVHLKLDELISSLEGARNRLVDLQNLGDEELRKLEAQFRLVHTRASHGQMGSSDAVKGEPKP